MPNAWKLIQPPRSWADSDVQTAQVLRWFALNALVLFYSLQYMVASVVAGVCNVYFDGSLPFNHEIGLHGEPLASLLCSVISFTLFGACLPLFLPSVPILWDHVVSVAIFHLFLGCIVELDFPLNYPWWLMTLASTAIAALLATIIQRFIAPRRVV